MTIRSTKAKYTGIKRVEDKVELENMELALNDIEALKQKIIRSKNHETNKLEYRDKLGKIKIAKNVTKNSLECLRKKILEQNTFLKTAKWYEYGEKSNKFFLNLTKFQRKKKLISTIKDGEKKLEGQKEVTKGIEQFYSNLYKRSPEVEGHQDRDQDFFKHRPKLNVTQRNAMDESLGLDELKKALFSCKESALGPDGIPYMVYKVFRQQISSIIKESWKYSVEQGTIPKDHRQSIITMIPKEGKDSSDIKKTGDP